MYCYKCVYQTFRLDPTKHYVYIFAEDMGDASRIFEEKKRWQWKLNEMHCLGVGYDKNSKKEDE